jgi:hypothetical protein
MSGTFNLWYRALLGVPVADPSCPYVLVRRAALDRLLPELGVLDPGLWWEFTARAYRTHVPLLGYDAGRSLPPKSPRRSWGSRQSQTRAVS